MNTATKVTLISLLTALAVTGCKPPAGSEVQTITGFDENGKAVALSLVPVRNFTVADLGASSSDPGVRQAGAMVKTQLLALVECYDVKDKKGKKLRAADLMGAVQFRAAINDLYVDEQRRLVTSLGDDRLAQYGSSAGKIVAIPCRVFGERLLSAGVMTDIQMRAAGLPKSLSNGKKVAMDTYRLSQALYLAMRGSYAKSEAFMPNVPALRNMLVEQIGDVNITITSMMKRLIAADEIYNPCVTSASSEYPWTAAPKTENFVCEAQGSIKGLSNYRAGRDGKGYVAVRNLIAGEIAATHNAVYDERAANDGVLFALWDVVTSGRPWSRYGGYTKNLATYLARGTGFNFLKVFESAAPGAQAAGIYKPAVVNKYVPTAPLAFALVQGETRVLPIQRASASTGADFSLLLGGSTSTADSRSGTMSGRVKGVAEVLGEKSKNGLVAMWKKAQPVLQEVRAKQ
jgi:hypothetical protein